MLKKIVNAGLCTGCGTCMSLCPKSAITIEKDNKKGIYSPLFDEEQCIDCNICTEVCPGLIVDFKDLNSSVFGKQPKITLIGNYLDFYIGHANNRDIRFNSASGGLATSLLHFLLDEQIIDGALITRFNEHNPLEPEVFIAKTKEQITSGAGSKYCPVPLNVGLKSILEEDGRYAVVGLPCHIHGIRKAEKINAKLKKRIILHLGIFCANSVTFLGTEYFLQSHGIRITDVKKISYRGKGWPGKIVITFRNQTEKILNRGTNETSILQKILFSSSFHYDFTPPRCLICRDQTCELADISLGDPWLPDLLKTEKIGKSLIISRTGNGASLLQDAQLKGIIDLIKIDKDTFLKTQNFNYKKEYNSRLLLLKYLGKPVPDYNIQLEKLELRGFFKALYYFPSYLSSRKYLWHLIYPIALFRFYINNLLTIGSIVKKIIKMINYYMHKLSLLPFHFLIKLNS